MSINLLHDSFHMRTQRRWFYGLGWAMILWALVYGHEAFSQPKDFWHQISRYTWSSMESQSRHQILVCGLSENDAKHFKSKLSQNGCYLIKKNKIKTASSAKSLEELMKRYHQRIHWNAGTNAPPKDGSHPIPSSSHKQPISYAAEAPHDVIFDFLSDTDRFKTPIKHIYIIKKGQNINITINSKSCNQKKRIVPKLAMAELTQTSWIGTLKDSAQRLWAIDPNHRMIAYHGRG